MHANLALSGYESMVVRTNLLHPGKTARTRSACLGIFEKAGYRASLEVNNATPDQDFYRMSHAKHIVVSSGGYSGLVGRNSERHGGRIYGRFFEKTR